MSSRSSSFIVKFGIGFGFSVSEMQLMPLFLNFINTELTDVLRKECDSFPENLQIGSGALKPWPVSFLEHFVHKWKCFLFAFCCILVCLFRLIFARLWQNTNVMLSMLSEGTHFTHATLCCCDTSYDSVLVLVHVCNVSAFYQNWWMDQAGFHIETLLNQSYTDFLSKFKYQAFIKK